MVNYWFCVTNEKNWKTIKENSVWGIPQRYRKLIERVEKGDFLVFYVRPKRIAGIFQVVSTAFYDNTRVFSSEGFKSKESFPHRVRIKPLFIPQDFIQIDDFIPKLRFIVSKSRWAGYFRRAMFSIPKEDYDFIWTRVSSKE